MEQQQKEMEERIRLSENSRIELEATLKDRETTQRDLEDRLDERVRVTFSNIDMLLTGVVVLLSWYSFYQSWYLFLTSY